MASAPEPGSGPIRVWSDVGDRLRHARVRSHLTVRALAASIGVSPSLISQIETGKVRPSVNTLYALSVELGLSVDEILFGAPPNAATDGATDRVTGVRVQRSTSRASVEPAPGVLWERLTGTSEPGVDFLYLTYAPGGESVPEGASHRHAGREWGYVVGGTLRVDVAGDSQVLRAGDAITYPSTEVHRLSNPGTRDMQAVWFVLGRRHLADGAPG